MRSIQEHPNTTDEEPVLRTPLFRGSSTTASWLEPNAREQMIGEICVAFERRH